VAALALLVGGLAVLLALPEILGPRTKVASTQVATTKPGQIVTPPTEEKSWKPSPADSVLRGLIPRPAAFAGVKRWQIETAAPRGSVHAVAWHPDGQLLACGTFTGEVRVYDAQTLQLVRLLVGHLQQVNAVAWSPDGTRLASVGDDKTIRLWEVDGTPGAILQAKTAVSSIAWSPDGKRLASISYSLLQLWDADGTPGAVLPVAKTGVYSVGWSPDNKRLATASSDKLVRLWDVDGTPGPVLKGHTNVVYSVAWSPDSKRLASVSTDRTVRLWEADGTPGLVLQLTSNQPTVSIR
jgi:WD40 repeat protein